MVNAAARPTRVVRSPLTFLAMWGEPPTFHGITDTRPCCTVKNGIFIEWAGRKHADKTSRLLDVKYFMLLPSVTDVGTPLERHSVGRGAAVGERAGGRKRHGHISPEQNHQFSRFLDHEFPRSIHYCLTTANDAPARDFRHADRDVAATPPSSAWASYTPSWLTPTRTRLLTRRIMNSSMPFRPSKWWIRGSTTHFLRLARGWGTGVESANDRQLNRAEQDSTGTDTTMIFEISRRKNHFHR